MFTMRPPSLSVQGNDLIEVSLGRIEKCPRHEPPGIVDENIEPAELLHRLDHKAPRLCNLTHVGLDGDGLPTLGLNARHYLMCFLCARSIIHHHNSPVFSQPLCNCSPDPAG
jgi:hypothetical protein